LVLTEEDAMELMDRAKQVAGDVGELAKKGASQVQAKIEHVQLRRKADDAAKRLGYLVVRERSEGRSSGAEVDALVAEVRDAEAQIATAERAAGAVAAEPPMTPAPEAAKTPAADVPAPTTPRAPRQGDEEAAGE
jgi:seryl-tRNA synthetase